MATHFKEIKIKEEKEGLETGGHFGAETAAFTATASTTTHHDVTPNIDISLLSAQIHVKGLSNGDKIGICIAPETTVGTLPGSVSATDKVITVPQSVIDLFVAGTLFVGQKLHLNDGTNNDDCGTITAYDDGANTITCKDGATNAFVSGDDINITTCMTPNVLGSGHIEILGADHVMYHFGEDKIGGSRVDAGKVIRVSYTETTGATPKVIPHFSYLY